MRRAALVVLGALLASAFFADCIASERPILLHRGGVTYWLPNIVEYEELRGLSGESLRSTMTEEDWALWPPVRHGPLSTRSAGELFVLEPPTSRHWLGTDDVGRDVLARLIHGTRSTAIMGGGAAALALLFGLVLAIAAAARPRWLDGPLVTIVDVTSAMPAIVVVIAVQGLLGTASLALAVLIVALPRAADTARIARAGLREALASAYCEAARAMGASRAWIILRHALPHVRAQLAIASAITAATAVLAEAALSFLGFGTPPPQPSWGEVLKQASENDLAWWLVFPAGAMVAAVAAALGILAQARPRVPPNA